jgi:hypothetical protein
VGFVFFADSISSFMKTNRVKIGVRYNPALRFDVAPEHAVPFRGTRETELERLKNQLLQSALNKVTDIEFYAPLRRAASEAVTAAWLTPFPLLFFPTLFEEQIVAARKQFERAQSVRARSRQILAEVL